MKSYINIVILLFLLSCSKESVDKPIITHPINEASNIEVRQLNFPSENYVMVASHRGGYLGTPFPENSLSAIQNSLDFGVDIIEIDIRITKDNKLVVIHDKLLDRTTNGSGLIKEHTLEDIKSLYLKDENGLVTSERIPTLAEVMITVGNKALVFIDKSEYLIDYVVEVLNETNSVSQALFIDFVDVESARSRYINLLKESYYIPGIHRSNIDLDQYYFDYKKTLNPNPSAFAFWFKEENSKAFSLIANAKNNKIPVWINATHADQCAGHDDALSLSNPEAGWGWLINKGANIIFTDRPNLLLKYLKDKGFR